MDRDENKAITAGTIDLIAGIWLFFSPFFLGLTGTMFATNAYIVGLLIAIAALIRLFAPMTSGWAGWVNAILGLWLLVYPFIRTGLTAGAMWNSVILGLVVIVASLWSLSVTTMHHPHMRAG